MQEWFDKYVFYSSLSLLQFTDSSSSIIASFSCLFDLSHFSWTAAGTLQRPEGFFSHNRRSRFNFAPSVAGAGRSGGGFTEVLPDPELGFFPGEGAATFGGGVV